MRKTAQRPLKGQTTTRPVRRGIRGASLWRVAAASVLVGLLFAGCHTPGGQNGTNGHPGFVDPVTEETPTNVFIEADSE